MNASSLEALRDIHLPPPPMLWSAPELWIAAASLALAAALLYARRWRRRRALRNALRELAGIAAAHARERDATALACALSRLVRRYAIRRFPNAGSEALTGIAWLRFLDAHGGNGAFCDGPGATLASRPYQAQGEVDTTALIALVRCWLEANPQ